MKKGTLFKRKHYQPDIILLTVRWQIEILFKTWKSFFHIHHCKKIKRERLECHLYGQLIAILLSSSFPSNTERHPRAIKDSHSPVQPPTAKWAKISSKREKTVFDILGVVYNYTIPDNQAA